jgi:hypothetical protein
MDTLYFFEDGGVLDHTHTKKFICSPIFIQDIVRVLSELFHVCPNKHLTKFDEVAMFFIIDFDNTPRVSSTTNHATIRSVYKPI